MSKVMDAAITLLVVGSVLAASADMHVLAKAMVALGMLLILYQGRKMWNMIQ